MTGKRVASAFPGHLRPTRGPSSVVAEDGQGLLGPQHTQHPQDSTKEGAGGSGGPGSPGRACPRTCPTPTRAGGASQGRSLRESPGPPSWAPAPTPGARRGGGRPPAAATCGTGPAAPGLGGQGRVGRPSRAGGGTLRAEGDQGHRGDNGSRASSLSDGPSCAPAPGPTDPSARPLDP